jgi:hypothetical protein
MTWKYFLPLILISTIFSCSKSSTYRDEHGQISSDSTLIIEFKRPSNKICNSNFEEFTISDKKLIRETINSINEATINGPWKGACWIEIHISSKNKTKVLQADQKVFSWTNSGSFYNFPTENYIEQLRIKNLHTNTNHSNHNDVTNIENIPTAITRQVNFESFDTIKEHFCSPVSIEIILKNNIYDSLPDIRTDSIKVKGYFTSEGFIQTDFGRGNWQDGPRFLYSKMEKDSCVCHLYRKFKSYEKQANGYHSIKVSERVICNSVMYMDE